MAITSPNPACLVNATVTTNGVDVTAGSTVTIQLFDTAGVAQWNLTCINTDDLNSAATINAGLSIDLATKTATFTAPNTPVTGSALIFQSKVNNGIDPNGTRQPSYTTTFKVAVLTSTSLRIFAFDEELENDASFGWLTTINYMIRNYGAGSGLLAGAGLYVSGGAYNVGQNADGSIVVNANDIQLKPAFTSLLTNATASNVGNTLVGRDPNGDFAMRDITLRNIIASGTTMTLSVVSNTFSFLTSNVAGSVNSSTITMSTGTVVNGNGGNINILGGHATGVGSTGQINIISGDVTSGSSGSIVLLTGFAFSSGGVSGSITLTTGATTDSASGNISFKSGDTATGNTGTATFGSGAVSSTGSASGALSLKSGTVTTGLSGALSIQSGAASGAAGRSGSLSIGSGNTTSGNSGSVFIFSGTPSGGGTGGDILIYGNGGGNISLGSSSGSFGSGKKVVYIANASVIPSTDPSGGAIIYASGGNLWARTQAGVIKQLA